MNPYLPTTKIYNLFEQIKLIDNLKDLLVENNSIRFHYNYDVEYSFESSGLSHLHKCVIRANKHPFLNDYIDEYLKLHPNTIDVKNDYGSTPLMLAILGENIKLIKILLKHNANVNILDKNGWNSLRYAIYSFGKNHIVKVGNMLIKSGVNVNFEYNDGQTAIINAVSSITTYGLVEILLKHNAEVNFQNKFDGNTALMRIIKKSVFNNGANIIQMLLDYGSNTNLEDIDCNNVFTLAFKKCTSDKIITILLPNRKIFFNTIFLHKKKILKNKSDFWRVKLCDLKMLYSNVDSFSKIIKQM